MLLNYIKKMFEYSFTKEYYDTYWCFDMHGTIIKPSYNLNDKSIKFYPYAQEALELISQRDDIITILYTCSYPNEIENYKRLFRNKNIHFDHVNENPDISSNNGNFGYYKDKFYFNVLFEDKAGFDPEEEWEEIYKYLLFCAKINHLPDPKWVTKY